MLKLFIQILFVYMILQWVFKVDINQYVTDFIQPKIQEIGLEHLDLEQYGIDEKLLENLSADEIKQLIEESDLNGDAAAEKLQQIEAELKKHLEKAKEKIEN